MLIFLLFFTIDQINESAILQLGGVLLDGLADSIAGFLHNITDSLVAPLGKGITSRGIGAGER